MINISKFLIWYIDFSEQFPLFLLFFPLVLVLLVVFSLVYTCFGMVLQFFPKKNEV